MKTCGSCKKEKSLTDFYIRPRGDYAWECKDCTKQRGKEHNERMMIEDPIKYERLKANRYLRHTYGITIEQYEEMFVAQAGVCAICEEEQQDGIRLCVDHDHSCCYGRKSCGKCIRQLLCTRCNTTLGKMNDDPKMLRNAADYIEKWKGI